LVELEHAAQQEERVHPDLRPGHAGLAGQARCFGRCWAAKAVRIGRSRSLGSARSAQSRQWPSVEGTVLESRVDDAHLEFMKPMLRYRYAVDGRSYMGFRVAFSGYGISRQAMASLILATFRS
jgi:hypothetical protein